MTPEAPKKAPTPKIKPESSPSKSADDRVDEAKNEVNTIIKDSQNSFKPLKTTKLEKQRLDTKVSDEEGDEPAQASGEEEEELLQN